jgi:hypothetical protein
MPYFYTHNKELMKRIISGALLLCSMLVLFNSCKKSDDNARHIPKNATAVFSLNMGSIGKKLAWEFLFGSDMFKKMTQGAGKDSSTMKDLQDAGIDFLGSFYVYVATDKRYSGEQRTVALIPISSDSKWDAYVKKAFPSAKIKTIDKRKEALLADGMYAGWNDEVLIIMNIITKEGDEVPYDANGNYIPPPLDEVQTAAEMDNAFKMTKENSVTDNKSFAGLIKEGHDMSLWVNYENVMDDYGAGMMGGFTLSKDMLKDAVFVSGFDFEKGAIKGDMRYYVSEELKAVTKDLMGSNADKDMVQRLPATNQDVLAAMNLSPKALKGMLDKFGLLGIINVALAEQKLSADDIFDAFTGDMAFSMNNFKVVPKKIGYTYYDDNMEEKTDSSTSYDPSMDWIYVMKINDQAKFDKLLALATTMGGLQSQGNGVYTTMNAGADAPHMIVKDKFLVVAANAGTADAFITGANKGQKMNAVAEKHVYSNPMTMFFDVKQMFAGIGPETISDPKDLVKFNEVKKLLDNAVMSGGAFKDGAFRYELSINFNNKDENSLMQLIQMANALSETKEEAPAVVAN